MQRFIRSLTFIAKTGMMLTAFLIFIATIVLVIWQPKGLGYGWSALLGATLALLTGVIHLHDIPVVWDIVWNATFTFVAIIVISLLLDEAGLFEWAALHVARWGDGDGRRLFIFLVALEAAVAALFTNDGATLILTPIVIAILLALKFSSAAALAFVMAAGFIADAASLPFVVSNLVNIVSANFFRIGFTEYASIMIPVNIASVAAALTMLMWFFRRDIPQYYDVTELKNPREAILDRTTFRAGWLVLSLLLIGFFGSEHIGVPISAVAGTGMLFLLGVSAYGRMISIRKVVGEAPWQILLFSLGMYLVVYGLRNQGLTDYLTEVLNYFADYGILGATLGTGLLIALLSAVMNNLPTVLIGVLSIDASNAGGVVRQAMIYANIIGSDLGPKFTPIGSLATLLWLNILARKNIRITWGYYFKVGMILTLPVLLVTLIALAVRLSI